MTTGKMKYEQRITNLHEEIVLLNQKIDKYTTHIQDLVIKPIEQIPFVWKSKNCGVVLFTIGIMDSEKLHIIQLPMKYFHTLNIPNITSIEDPMRIDFKHVEWIYTIEGLVGLISTYSIGDRGKFIDNIMEFMTLLDDKEAKMYLANYM